MTLDELNIAVSLSADEALEKLDALIERVRALASGAEGLGAGDMGRALADTGSEMERAAAGAQALCKAAAEIERRFGAAAAVRRSIAEFRDLRAEYQRAAAGGRDAGAAFDALKAAAAKLGLELNETEGSLDACGAGVDALEKNVARDAGGMAGALAAMLAQAQAAETALNVQAAMGVDVSQPLTAVQAVIALVNGLLSLMGQAGIEPAGTAAKPRRTGGGGGSAAKPSAGSAAKGKSAYEKAMEEIEHLKALDQLTYEQELEHLEAIARKYRLTAEEKRRLEEDIYAVQKAIRERDAEQLDAVADALTQALTARWEAMREAELKRLDESRDAWDRWRDDCVAAVEGQIAALDRLGDAEDRERRDAEELRKIEKLRREIEYEQDAYSRAKLGQQLEAAIAAREERLGRLALQDQKDALRQEIERVNERADAALAGLDEERERVEALYDERLKAASLAAETEKALTTSTQDEIVALIRSYAPDYDLAGRTLGERLAEGFRERVADIGRWFDELSARLEELERAAAGAAAQAAGGFADGARAASGGVTITQTNTFNQPVETPGETARRIRQANEALAEELMRGA